MALFAEVQVSLFVAGAVFGEVQVSLFVAGAVFGETIHAMLPFLELVTTKQQQVVWKQVSLLTASMHTVIVHELQSQDCLPNKWKNMVHQKMIRSLVLAAERHFQKKMRRQIRSLPEMPLVVISDESENGDDESDVEFVLESFIPSVSRRAS